MKAIERKHGFLHRPILRPDFFREAELLQGFSSHDLRGEFRQWFADGFRDERHGARGARVHFENINRLALDRVLHVHQADDF